MRILLVFILWCSCLKAFASRAHDTIPTTKYISEARRIMLHLGISERANYEFDGPINILVFDSDTSAVAHFAAKPYLVKKGKKKGSFFYKYPTIRISKELDSIITKRKVVNDTMYYHFESIVIHEFVHYLQAAPLSPNYRQSFPADSLEHYIQQPVELESYAVQAYYFLERSADWVLKKINGLELSKKKNFEAMIEAHVALTTSRILHFE